MKRIVPYNPIWKDFFATEAKILSKQLGTSLVAIHHIGSTSITDMPAKPIIDILIEVTSLLRLDESSQAFAARDYEVRGEYEMPERRYFSKKPTEEVLGYHIHAYKVGDYQIRRHLGFRDYLQQKPHIAAQYVEIKRKLSNSDGVLVESYQNAKKPWVDRISLEALRYFIEQI